MLIAKRTRSVYKFAYAPNVLRLKFQYNHISHFMWANLIGHCMESHIQAECALKKSARMKAVDECYRDASALLRKTR